MDKTSRINQAHAVGQSAGYAFTLPLTRRYVALIRQNDIHNTWPTQRLRNLNSMRFIFIIIMFFLLGTPVLSEELERIACNELPGPVKPIFTPAFENDGSLFFKPIFEIDWIKHAPDEIRLLDTNNPSGEDIELLRENRILESFSEIVYSADLDCSTFIGKYYLVSSTGISPAKPLNLRGRARFTLVGEKIQRPEYLGDIEFSTASSDTTEGGFVVLVSGFPDDKPPFKITSNPKLTATASNGKVTYRFTTSDGELQLIKNRNPEYDHSLEIETLYEFGPSARGYVFVKWRSDGSGLCSYDATLFEVNRYGRPPSLEIISTVGYGCGQA